LIKIKIILADFNVSAVMMGGVDNFKSVEGTTYFFAPECCKDDEEETKKGYAGKPVDIWALGVTTFILIFKRLPFSEDNSDNVLGLYDMIAKGEYFDL
jgi:serine/threonine protein kinase